MPANNKKIAKNTIILFVRQILVIFVGLYTSRVILQSLGVTDYGIYGIVGGIVGFMGFLNGALANSSSRFITYALGKKDESESERTFTTTLTIHIILGFIILVVGECIGTYMLYNHVNIPSDRMSSAFIAFQFSLLTMSFGISQVPYSGCFISHENFTLIAYMSLWDVVVKLLIAFGLLYYNGDCLILFSALIFANSVGTMLFYRFYCTRKYKEVKFRLHIDKNIFRKILTFTGWDFMYQFAYALNSQGTTILIGMFFNPVVVAAKTISVKVNSMTTQFIGQFRSASTPQIVKLYANNELLEFKSLVLSSALYSFYIMWCMTLPICLLAQPLLEIWLGDVPKYSSIFVQLIMIDSLFWLFDCSFNVGIMATGKMKWNSILSSIINILRFPIVYFFFKLGFSPISSFIISICFGFIIGCILKPSILKYHVKIFKYKDFFNIYFKCLLVAFISTIIPFIFTTYLDKKTIIGFIIIGLVSILSAIITIYLIGIDKTTQNHIKSYFYKKLNINQ